MRRLEMIAVDRLDGWAYIKENGDIFRFESPYGPDDKHEASEDESLQAISKYGFEQLSMIFDTYFDIANFLRREKQEANKALGYTLKTTDLEDVRKFIERLPSEQLVTYLEMLRNKYLDNGNFKALTTILNFIKPLKAFSKNPEAGQALTVLEKDVHIHTDELTLRRREKQRNKFSGLSSERFNWCHKIQAKFEKKHSMVQTESKAA